ncbi:MAG: hypothetical protein IKN38_09960 [Clostridia bacterium]|nr:hypothetical protein [Clostridia bacterium]
MSVLLIFALALSSCGDLKIPGRDTNTAQETKVSGKTETEAPGTDAATTDSVVTTAPEDTASQGPVETDAPATEAKFCYTTLDEAQSRAECVIRKYLVFEAIGTVCEYTSVEMSDPIFSSGITGTYGNFVKIDCCKTAAEAKQHPLELFAPALCMMAPADYYEYNGALYADIIPRGLTGSEIKVTSFDDNAINADVVYMEYGEVVGNGTARLENNGTAYVLTSLN